MALLLTSCLPNQKTIAQPVVTERQTCFLKQYMHLEELFPLTIAMDVPIEGSRMVLDSITCFLNETLYQFFDTGEAHLFPFESVFSKKTKQIATHYRETYAPSFHVDRTDEHEFAADCLEVNLVAQTDTYLTYEICHIFFGEGIETAKEWVTFAKNDGHRLAEVISRSDLLAFYKSQPDYRNNGVWEDLCYQSGACEVGGSLGLLTESVAHQYVYAPGIFEDITYPLTAIAPYLSKEAQQLIHSSIHCLVFLSFKGRKRSSFCKKYVFLQTNLRLCPTSFPPMDGLTGW